MPTDFRVSNDLLNHSFHLLLSAHFFLCSHGLMDVIVDVFVVIILQLGPIMHMTKTYFYEICAYLQRRTVI